MSVRLLQWIRVRLGSPITRGRCLRLAAILLPFGVYLFLAWGLSEWIIDDAGITFSYSRSLAQGHGLVSQSGMPPVEGYSNPLWMLVMVPFFICGVFHPYIVPKLISYILVAMTFWLLHRLVSRVTGGFLPATFAALSLLAVNASFVIWTCSGLENALYAALIVGLTYLHVEWTAGNCSWRYVPIISALLTCAIAMTRPDGVVYATLFPLALMVGLGPDRNNLRRVLRDFAGYATTFAMVFGAFILFRYSYFNDLYPNTYYVKGGPTLDIAIQALTLQGGYLNKFYLLVHSMLGSVLWWLIPVGCIVLLVSALFRAPRWRASVVMTASMLLAAYTYLILGEDWMGEYRFATPFFPLACCCLVAFVHVILTTIVRSKPRRLWIASAVFVTLLILSVDLHYPRIQHYVRSKPVSFERIATQFGRRFNDYAGFLRVSDASFLVPDMGGTLYYSKLRIHDLAGLCDKTIARTRGRDQQRFFDYVFKDLKPTFIHTHGYFTAVSKFDDDPRFFSDYVSINEYVDKYVETKYGETRISGDFVRKAIVAGKEALLDSLRQGLAP